jgi:hypothetical protein
MKVTSPTDSRRQRLKVRNNDDVPLLKGAPPIKSGGLHCVDHGPVDATHSNFLQGIEAQGPLPNPRRPAA